MDEFEHFLSDVWHSQDVDDLRPLFFILHQKFGYQVFQFGRVHVGYGALLVLHNFEDETEKIFA